MPALLTTLGSLYNDSCVSVKNISMNVAAGGVHAYIFGGIEGSTKLELMSVDAQIKLNTRLGSFTSAKDDDLRVGEGRYRVIINDEPVDVIPNI